MALISITSLKETVQAVKLTTNSIEKYKGIIIRFEELLTKFRDSFMTETLDLESLKMLSLIASLVKKNPNMSQEMVSDICKRYSDRFETITITRFTQNLYA